MFETYTARLRHGQRTKWSMAVYAENAGDALAYARRAAPVTLTPYRDERERRAAMRLRKVGLSSGTRPVPLAKSGRIEIVHHGVVVAVG